MVLLRYSFLVFSFISTCLMGSASNILKCLLVSFSTNVLIFSWLGSAISSVMCRFPLFITSMVHFSMPNSIPISWLYIFTVYISNSFSLLATVWCRPCTLLPIYWVCIWLCISWEYHWVASSLLQIVMVIVHIPGICLSGSFPQLSSFPLAVNSTLQFSIVSSINFMTLSGILYILRHCNISCFGGPYRKHLCSRSRR